MTTLTKNNSKIKTENDTKCLFNNKLSFAKQIDAFLNGSFPSNEYLYLGDTPLLLCELGFPNNPIILKQSKLKK